MYGSEAPARHTTWTVTRADRVEVRDRDGDLITSSRPDRKLPALRDRDDRLAVTFKPGIKGMFSGRNLLSLAITSIFNTDGTGVYRPGSRVNSPAPLNLTALPGSVTFAAIMPSDDSTYTIDLLPPGSLNDRAVARAVDPALAARLRAASPLTLIRGADDVYTLQDQTGCIVARAVYGMDESGRPAGDQPESVEVLDNSLPSMWLYAILVGCRHWHR